jgi:hypothetical protein
MWSTCIPCVRKKAEAEARLSMVRDMAIERAKQNERNYIIWLDEQDYRLRIIEAETAIERGYRIVEVIFRPADTA